MPKVCPECGLLNPEAALRCDCGYDFPSGIMKEPYVKPIPRRSLWVSMALFVGAIFCFFPARELRNAGFIPWNIPLGIAGGVLAGWWGWRVLRPRRFWIFAFAVLALVFIVLAVLIPVLLKPN